MSTEQVPYVPQETPCPPEDPAPPACPPEDPPADPCPPVDHEPCHPVIDCLDHIILTQNNTQIISALIKAKNTIKTVVNDNDNICVSGNRSGNEHTDLNNASCNHVNVSAVGRDNSSVCSAHSNNDFDNCEANNNIINYSPFEDSPMVVNEMNNVCFNILNQDTETVNTCVDQRSSHTRKTIIQTRLASWCPFIKKMQQIGYTDVLHIIDLLMVHDGDYTKVISELAE